MKENLSLKDGNSVGVQIFEATQVAVSTQFLQMIPSTLDQPSFFLALAEEMDLTFCEQIEDGCPVLVGLWDNVQKTEAKLKRYLYTWLESETQETLTESRNQCAEVATINDGESVNASSEEVQIETETTEVLSNESDLVPNYGFFITDHPQLFLMTNRNNANTNQELYCVKSSSKSGSVDVEQDTKTKVAVKNDNNNSSPKIKEIFVDIALSEDILKHSKGSTAKKGQKISKQNTLDKLCKLLCIDEDEAVEKRLARSDYKQRREEAMPFKYFCQDCSFKTKRETHFKKHLDLHKKVKKILCCDQCDFKTIRESVLCMHKFNHGPAKFICEHCSFRTNKLAHLKYHSFSEHGVAYKKDSLIKCRHCDFTASSKQEVRKHKYLAHDCTEQGKTIWKCSQCAYQSAFRSHVKRHENDIHGEDNRPFLCHYCGMRFKRNATLVQHKITHGEVNRKFLCQLCGRDFNRLIGYKEHMATHSDKRPFLCDICGMSFKTFASTKRHRVTVHLTKEVFPCPYCDRKYKTKAGRNQHKKSHRVVKAEHKVDTEVECVEETVQDQETFFNEIEPSEVQIVYTGTVLSDQEIVI